MSLHWTIECKYNLVEKMKLPNLRMSSIKSLRLRNINNTKYAENKHTNVTPIGWVIEKI